ncbi:hypothetical protein BKA83DRAFT_276854 [Pisolithus microcarpus]|nr:hypothetical protein BKA83DRAFT_276854 [Pisolithus microcarpus]
MNRGCDFVKWHLFFSLSPFYLSAHETDVDTMNSHTDEMRYWRNFAMRRGHEQLDPDRVLSAIRDIYENDLLHDDIRDGHRRQTGPRSSIRMPQDPLHDRAVTPPHIPRAHTPTSLCPRGNQSQSRSHPRAPMPNHAHALRPVVPAKEQVTPVIPSGMTCDQEPRRPSNGGCPLLGISSRPPLQRQTPRRRPLSPHQQQPHGSDTHAYGGATQLDPAYPLPSPRLSPLHIRPNEGIRINPEPVIPTYHMHPQYSHPLPFVDDTSRIPPPGRPDPRPSPTPELYAFSFPTHPLIQTPDSRSPQQCPSVPAAAPGRTGNTESGREPRSGQLQRPAPPPTSSAPAPVQQHPPTPPPASSMPERPPPPPPYDPSAAAAATHPLGGGWPFYRTCHPFPTPGAGSIPQWSPHTWPPMSWPTDTPVRLAPWLIPNPVDPYVPQLEWDVSRHPSTARRVTGAHVTIPLDSAVGGGGGGSTGTRIDNEPVTFPASDRIVVSCDQIGIIGQLWGPIVIERSGGRSITVRDLLAGIYAFFRTHVTRAEVDRISSLGRDNYRSMVDAYRRRTTRRDLGALRDWEWREGMRRVDCLGEGRWWWGVWVTYPYHNDGDDNLDGPPWRLHLGLVDSAHRNVINI